MTFSSTSSRLVGLGLATTLGVTGGLTVRHLTHHTSPHPDPTPFTASPQRTPGEPNPNVTQSNIQSTICLPGYTSTIRPPANYTNLLKKQQLKADPRYSQQLHDTNPAHFEEDHFLPLELGGHPIDDQNLWPEPLTTAHSTDQLENSLHQAVCNGSITLLQGQAVIRSHKYNVG